MTTAGVRHPMGSLWPAFFLLLIALALHAPIWSGRVDFYSGPASDLVPYVQGLKTFQYRTLHRCGELPLWNPHLLFGQPVVGNIQHALFYPLNALFWVFPFFTAVWVSQALHMALAGVGAWLLARRIGCRPLAGFTAGGLYMVNGRILYYINAGWVGYLHAICWLPLILWAGLGLVNRREAGASTLAGLLLALCLLSGTPQYAFVACGLMALQVAGTAIRPSAVSGGRGFLAGRLAWTGLVFFVLSAVQILPSAEQAWLSSRPLSSGASMGFHFDWDPAQWVRILLRPEFLAHDHAWELCGYIGIGGLALALAGLISGFPHRTALLVWAGIPVLLSMGPAVPWLDRWVHAVPGLSMLVSPSRYFIFTVLVLCVAAGRGMQALLDAGWHKRPAPAGWSAFLCLLAAGAALVPLTGDGGSGANGHLLGAAAFSALCIAVYRRWPGRLAAGLLAAWLVIDPLSLLAPQLLTGYRSADLFTPRRILASLAESSVPVRVAVIQPSGLQANLVSVVEDPVFVDAGIDRVGGYEPLALLRSLAFVTRMDGTPLPDTVLWGIRPFAMARPELFRIAGVTHLIFTEEQHHPLLRLQAQDRIDGPDFHGGRWRNQPVYLYDLAEPLPKAYFLPRGDGRADPGVSLASPSPNRRRLLLNKPVPGRVVLSETYHGGWRARIDGRPAAVHPFLNAFLSVELPAGARRVDLTFCPASYVTGRRVTAGGMIFLVLLGSFQLYRSRRASRRARP